jgi:hypothetical protein
MSESILGISNTLFNGIIAITSVIVAYSAFRVIKKNRGNIINFENTVISFNEENKDYWYIKIQIEKCDETIKLLQIKLIEQFSLIHSMQSSENFLFKEIGNNVFFIINITGLDYIILSCSLDKKESQKYYELLEKDREINSILTYSAENLRLKRGFLKSSKFNLDAKRETD